MAGVILSSIRLDNHNVPLVSLGHREHFAAILSEGAGRRHPGKPFFPTSLSWVQGLLFPTRGLQRSKKRSA